MRQAETSAAPIASATPDSTGADVAAGIWDREWIRTWKAHPENVWFGYEAAVYAEQVGAWDRVRRSRALKTDAFDEACGRRHLVTALGDVVLIDVSPKVVRHAARAVVNGIVACAADVRRLPFPDGCFDLVLSTSTLDHFDRHDDIGLALAELRRVLGPGGRLVVTLDNPANPILLVRRLVYGLTGAISGVIPFRMGLTLSRRGLVDAVEAAGFAVRESGYVVHAPRIVALWIGEWAARRGSPSAGRRLDALLRRIECAARRLPTQRWTAHFIFADCRAEAPPPLGPPSAPGAPADGRRVVLPRWLLGLKQAELWLRITYLRMLPRAVVARVDPVLRRVVGMARRTAAVPIYLRRPLRGWSGRVDNEPARVAVWSAPQSAETLFAVLFDGQPAVGGGAAIHRLPAVVRDSAALAPDADLLIAHTTPLLAPIFQRAGFHVVPGMVRFGGSPSALLAGHRPNASLASDFRRMRHSGYRVERWPHTRERSRLFYERYLLPHALERFREDAEVTRFDIVDRIFAAGIGLALMAPGQHEPDVVGIVVPRGDVLWCVFLGTRDADPAVLGRGGIAALYLAQIRLAEELHARAIDFGRCVPWASDGIYQFKWKWGLRPVPDSGQTLEYAVKVLRPESASARRLVTRGVLIREGRSCRPFRSSDLG